MLSLRKDGINGCFYGVIATGGIWPIVRVEHFARKLSVAESGRRSSGGFTDNIPKDSPRPLLADIRTPFKTVIRATGMLRKLTAVQSKLVGQILIASANALKQKG